MKHIPPVIIYTGRELTEEENRFLTQYSSSVVLKGNHSLERLLDETLLFLHSLESSLPDKQRRMLRMIHDKDQVLSGKKILLVDDDLRNAFALSNVLQQYGMNIILADNGEMALVKIQEEHDLDLIIMDIMMPVMDGYEAITKIRKMESGKKIPVIALTAKAMPEDRHKCISSGADDYMAKPVDVDKMLSMMRVWLYEQS